VALNQSANRTIFYATLEKIKESGSKDIVFSLKKKHCWKYYLFWPSKLYQDRKYKKA